MALLLYATSVALGFLIDFRLALFLLLGIQVTWLPFCAARSFHFRHASDNDQLAISSYRFAAGGLIASVLLLLLVIISTQVV